MIWYIKYLTYSGYGTGFDKGEIFSFLTGKFGCTVICSRRDMSSSVHVDNKNKIF